MPKINREEYEILKELDDEWKWIARDSNPGGGIWIYEKKPSKRQGSWDSCDDGFNYLLEEDLEEMMFQFIKWEDENPYNIQELIEEYEYHQRKIERMYPVYNDPKNADMIQRMNESEGTEVKDKYKSVITDISEEYGLSDSDHEVIAEFFKLDEEILKKLSLETVGLMYQSSGRKVIDILDEHEALIPKQEDQDMQDYWKEATEFLVHERVFGYEGRDYIVVEKPTVPKFVAEWYEEKDNIERAIYWECIAHQERVSSYKPSETDEFGEWFTDTDNKPIETLINMKYGYEVEKEQKYVIEFPNIAGSDERYLVQGDDGDLWIDGGLDYLQRHDLPKHTFTEEEIKSFDPNYMVFAKKVEELEK